MNSAKITRGERISLDSILLLLIDRGLITEVERRIVASNDDLKGKQSAVYQLLLEKSPPESSSILKILKYFHSKDYLISDLSGCPNLDSENDVDDDEKNSTSNHALLNNVVIKQVFQYLNIQDILRCRLVCHKWNDVADPIIRKRVTINFSSLQPDKFVDIFKNSIPTLPFTSFVFSNIENRGTTSSTSITGKVRYFFRNWKQSIKEMSWKNTKISEGGKRIDIYNISPWIRMSEKLNFLHVSGGPDNSPETTRIKIYLSSLQGITNLELNNCRILLDKSVKIAPLKIQLEDVIFYRARDSQSVTGGTSRRHRLFDRLNEICLNDVISLTQVKEITLVRSDKENSDKTNLMLDASDEFVKLDKARADNVAISAWMEESNWEVTSLFVKNNSLATKMKVEVKELVVDSADFDLFNLPESIQKLCIIRYEGTDFSCSQPVCLPQLKHLFIDVGLQFLNAVFHDFFMCLPNLEEVSFINLDGSLDLETPFVLKLGLLPASVKAMKFNCPIVLRSENIVLNLDKLILDQFTLSQADVILNTIVPKVLVLKWKKQNNFEVSDSAVWFWKSHPELEKIIIGEFDWSFWKFSETGLSQCVDRPSKYYEFSNGVGTALSHDKFYELMKLYSGAFYNDYD